MRSVFLALFLIIFVSPSKADISVNPTSWGLSVGDTFRLVLVTNGTTDATNANITTYDTFVNTQGLSGIKYNGSSLSWQAVGTTMTSNAATDNSRYSSSANLVNVFNLNGIKVSNTGYNTFFQAGSSGPSHLSGVKYTINGSGNLQDLGQVNVYTGFEITGSASQFYNEDNSTFVYTALGKSATYQQSGSFYTNGAAYGWADDWRQQWCKTGYAGINSYSNRMYAMSELITVVAVPEPSTLLLGGIAAAASGVRVWMKRRRRLATAKASTPHHPNRPAA